MLNQLAENNTQNSSLNGFSEENTLHLTSEDNAIKIWWYFNVAIFFDVAFFLSDTIGHFSGGLFFGVIAFFGIFSFGIFSQKISFHFSKLTFLYCIYLFIPLIIGLLLYPYNVISIISLYIKFSTYVFVIMVLSAQRFDRLPWNDFHISFFLIGILVFLSMSVCYAPYLGNIQLEFSRGINEVRPSGFFKNSNIVTPLVFLQLFLIPKNKKFIAGIILFASILVLFRINANTAYLAIAFALLYYYFIGKRNHLGGLIFLVFAVIFAFYFNDRLLRQIELAILNFDAISTDSVNYNLLGGDSSFTWRMAYWFKMLSNFPNEPLFQIIFGHGFGASFENYGNLPHNEYLRVLYEEGVIGFFFFCCIISNLFRHASLKGRVLLVCYAVFIFSENTFDTFFVFMVFIVLICYDVSNNRIAANENPVN